MQGLEGIISGGDADVIRLLAEKAAANKPQTVDPNAPQIRRYLVPEGYELEDVDNEAFLLNPRRARSKRRTTDASSFAAYVRRHSTAASTVWADVDQDELIAVLDDHEPSYDEGDTATIEATDGTDIRELVAPTELVAGIPGWGDHKMRLELTQTWDWRHWLSKDREYMPQAAFAEHLKDGYLSITSPSSADMIELAQSFEATRKVDFKSGARIKSGEIELRYEETTDAKAGRKGTIEIPDEFTLQLAVFEAHSYTVTVTAHFRYRIVDGALQLRYDLERPDLAKREAFDEIVDDVAHAIGDVELFRGTPA